MREPSSFCAINPHDSFPIGSAKNPSALADAAPNSFLIPHSHIPHLLGKNAKMLVMIPAQTSPSQSAPHAARTVPPERALSAAERLATPVQYLKGVGPDRAPLLERLGLKTACDVLFFFPSDYQDLTDFRTIAALEEGTLSTVRGIVEETDLRAGKTGRSVVGVLIRDGTQ